MQWLAGQKVNPAERCNSVEGGGEKGRGEGRGGEEMTREEKRSIGPTLALIVSRTESWFVAPRFSDRAVSCRIVYDLQTLTSADVSFLAVVSRRTATAGYRWTTS